MVGITSDGGLEGAVGVEECGGEAGDVGIFCGDGFGGGEEFVEKVRGEFQVWVAEENPWGVDLLKATVGGSAESDVGEFEDGSVGEMVEGVVDGVVG